MTVLSLDKKSLEAIKSLRTFAEKKENYIDLIKYADCLDEAPNVGDNPDHVCYPNFNYRCAFSVEIHPGGICRHLSVSIEKKGRYPIPHAVNALLSEFGFRGDVNNQIDMYIEEESEAINVLGTF